MNCDLSTSTRIGHKASTRGIAGYLAILKGAVTITSKDAVMPIVGISAMVTVISSFC